MTFFAVVAAWLALDGLVMLGLYLRFKFERRRGLSESDVKRNLRYQRHGEPMRPRPMRPITRDDDYNVHFLPGHRLP